VSASATVDASLRRPGSPGLPWRVCESSDAGAPPDFSRSSASNLGGFRCSGRRFVTGHLEAAPSPGEFWRARVSDSSGAGGKGEKDEK
jgi:hypothetical protein